MIRTVDTKINVIRDGAILSRLHPVDGSAPVLRMDSRGSIKMSCSGDFLPNDDVDLLSDELQPVLILDGVEHVLGQLLPATVQQVKDSTSHYVRLDAYDRCWLVRDTIAETMIYFAAGTPYITAVSTLLYGCGITKILATPSAATLPEDRQWDVGVPYLDIVNELLSEINYKTLWFSAQGAAVLEPAVTPAATNIQHVLDSGNIRSLLLPQIARESDIYSAPNVFICICSNPDKSAALVATAVNDNPQSALSIQRRGRRIAAQRYVDNIASQAELDAYAQKVLFDSMTGAEAISVSTALFPGWGSDDVVALRYDDLAALCICRAWSMELKTGGIMSLTLDRVVYNLEL